MCIKPCVCITPTVCIIPTCALPYTLYVRHNTQVYCVHYLLRTVTEYLLPDIEISAMRRTKAVGMTVASSNPPFATISRSSASLSHKVPTLFSMFMVWVTASTVRRCYVVDVNPGRLLYTLFAGEVLHREPLFTFSISLCTACLQRDRVSSSFHGRLVGSLMKNPGKSGGWFGGCS